MCGVRHAQPHRHRQPPRGRRRERPTYQAGHRPSAGQPDRLIAAVFLSFVELNRAAVPIGGGPIGNLSVGRGRAFEARIGKHLERRRSAQRGCPRPQSANLRLKTDSMSLGQVTRGLENITIGSENCTATMSYGSSWTSQYMPDPDSACSGEIFRVPVISVTRQAGAVSTWMRGRGKGRIIDCVEVRSTANCAGTKRYRLRGVGRRTAVGRLESHRGQVAVGGHQVVEGVFLSQGEQPSAIDHHLGVEGGEAVNKAPPVLLARWRRLRNQPRVARLEWAFLIKRPDVDFLRLMEEQAAGCGKLLKTAVDVGHVTDFQIDGSGAKICRGA